MQKKLNIKQIEYNPVCDPPTVHGYRNVRWVENVSRGLRLVGFADEIARREGRSRMIDHKGWFTEDDGANGEVLRGVVYQLPARGGRERYVWGYADPNNDGCALLSFVAVDGKKEAAVCADVFASTLAEKERDYNRAWQAGRRCEDLDEKVKGMRSEALAIGREMREAKAVGAHVPTICAVLRDKIKSLRRAIVKARKERDELVDSFGREPGFVE